MAEQNVNWQRYAVCYTLTLLLLAVLVCAINAVVDPHGRLLLVDTAHFNQAKVAVAPNSRAGKATNLRQCDYDLIILGSSRAESGIRVDQPDLRGTSTYNAALKAASMYEMRRLIEYTLEHQDLQAVIIGLDFVSFSAHILTRADFAQSALVETETPASLMRYLFSWVTLQESFTTWRLNKAEQASICGDNGEHKPRPGAPQETDARTNFDFILNRYSTRQYDTYHYGEIHFEHLDMALRDLAARDVKVYAYISPIHALLGELIVEKGLGNDYRDWKRRLVGIFEDSAVLFSAAKPPELWDFSGYNLITTEALPKSQPGGQMKGYTDPAHYRKAVGDLILKRMLAPSAEEAFGERLTRENIEQVLADEQRDSQQYRNDNQVEI